MLEVASPNTWREDVERKPGVYAGLGVREYFLFDPTGEHLSPRLQGYRLVDGAYEPLVVVESIDRTLTLASDVLGLELRTKGEEMRFHDATTDETLLSYDEERVARLAAEARSRGGNRGTSGRRGTHRGAGGTPRRDGPLKTPTESIPRTARRLAGNTSPSRLAHPSSPRTRIARTTKLSHGQAA